MHALLSFLLHRVGILGCSIDSIVRSISSTRVIIDYEESSIAAGKSYCFRFKVGKEPLPSSTIMYVEKQQNILEERPKQWRSIGIG